MYPMQLGDVSKTCADINPLKQDYHYHPKTNIKDGIEEFVSWYKNFYNK